jgi:two-component system cell cycle sensor histidine kinase/response regulator CckA
MSPSVPPRILNVDDDPAGLAYKSTLLRDAGFLVEEAASGLAALQAVAAATPDLLLLDVHLPDIDGFAVCLRVRENHALDWLPIVHVTAAFRESEDWIRGLSAGADAYLTCPIDPGVLIEVIRALLRRTEPERRYLIALRDSEERLRSLIDEAPHGILQTTVDGVLLRANKAIAVMLGYDTPRALVEVRDIAALYHDPAHRTSLRTALFREGRIQGAEALWRRRDGTLATVRLASRLVSDRHEIETFIEDISRHKELELQLSQAQKMEAVGRLAGGIAHDFNNILTAITGYSEMLLEQIGPDKPPHQDLLEIKKASHRAAGLTRQLLAFGRRQVIRMQPVQPNAAVTDVMKLLGRTLGAQVTIHTSLADGLHCIMADVVQLEQVLMNLAVNARDAMPAGGTLTIETANVHISEAEARSLKPLGPGDYVSISVSDTGTGIAPDLLGNIFEPFFTTKEIGKGTGLGLATVYGIVKQLAGFIWVRSEVGRGTTFRMLFPPCEEAAAVPATDAALPAQVGREVILLVEDDPGVRALAGSVLRRYGYAVLEADCGGAAVRLTEALDRPIDLLLTDIIMPGLTGFQLAEALQARYPPLRVLYMSGYSTEMTASHRAARVTARDVLDKPFAPMELLRRVRDTLDQPYRRPDAANAG